MNESKTNVNWEIMTYGNLLEILINKDFKFDSFLHSIGVK